MVQDLFHQQYLHFFSLIFPWRWAGKRELFWMMYFRLKMGILKSCSENTIVYCLWFHILENYHGRVMGPEHGWLSLHKNVPLNYGNSRCLYPRCSMGTFQIYQHGCFFFIYGSLPFQSPFGAYGYVRPYFLSNYSRIPGIPFLLMVQKSGDHHLGWC